MTEDREVSGSPRSPFAEALVVARYELAAMLLSVRAVLLAVVYGGITFVLGAIWVGAPGFVAEKIAEQSEDLSKEQVLAMMKDATADPRLAEKLEPTAKEIGGDRLAEAVRDGKIEPLGVYVLGVAKSTGGDALTEALMDALIAGRLSLLAFFVLLLSTFCLPGLVLLVGYDRISEDLHTRYARFVLQRVRRGSYLAGKIAGHWGSVLLLVMLVHLALLGLAAWSGAAGASQLARVLPTVWFGMALLLLAYSCFTALLSVSLSPPFAVLALGGTLLMFLWLSSTFVGPIRKLWMGTWDSRLWALDPPAIVVFAAHVILLGGLAYLRLRTRDV